MHPRSKFWLLAVLTLTLVSFYGVAFTQFQYSRPENSSWQDLEEVDTPTPHNDAPQHFGSSPPRVPPSQPPPSQPPQRNFATRQRIYTYMETVKTDEGQWGTDLAQLWLAYWWSRGYQPVILTRRVAESHPQYEYHIKTFSDYPTVNPKQYEMACYLRWVAFRVAGGGVFMDYDMFSMNAKDEQLFPEISDESLLLSDGKLLPMLTVAGPLGVDKILAVLANYTDPPILVNGVPHISDMIIIQKNSHIYSKLDQPLPLAHFRNFEHLHFQKAFNSTNTRKYFVSQFLMAHILNTNRVVFILPPGVTFHNFRECGFGCFPRVVDNFLEYLSLPKVFPNLKSPIKTFFPNLNPSVFCNLVFVNEWPTDYSTEHVVLVGYSNQTAGAYSVATSLSISDNVGRVFPLPLDNPMHAKLLLEYGVGIRLQHLPEFSPLESQGWEPNELLLTLLEARGKELLEEINEVENQIHFLKK